MVAVLHSFNAHFFAELSQKIRELGVVNVEVHPKLLPQHGR